MNTNNAQFDRYIEQIESENCEYIIFGANLVGSIVIKVLERLGKKVLAIFDNDCEKWGKSFESTEIIAPIPYDVAGNTIKVIICVNNVKARREIYCKLLQLGYTEIVDYYPIYFYWHVQVMNRNVDRLRFADMLIDTQQGRGELVIDHTLVILTDRCSLNCENCGHLVPHYTNPINYSTHCIVESVRRLASTVDRIELLSLLGGEPLMHPNLLEICEQIASIPNIRSIRIVTNGTVTLTKESLERIKKCITYFSLSDYGELSNNMDNLILDLNAFDIPYQITQDKYWYQTGLPQKLNSPDFAQLKYESCIWGRGCSAIQAGEFHICDYSTTGKRIGQIPDDPKSYVDLLSPSFNVASYREQIKALLTAETHILACEYCLFDFNTKVKPAIQL